MPIVTSSQIAQLKVVSPKAERLTSLMRLSTWCRYSSWSVIVSGPRSDSVSTIERDIGQQLAAVCAGTNVAAALAGIIANRL